MTANEVDYALSREPDAVGAALLALHEDQWFERKSAKLAAKDLGKPLVALANADGGVIVIGASNGKVDGFAGQSGKLNDFRQAPLDFTAPPVRATFAETACQNDAGDDDMVLVVRVEPSERVHETAGGDCYLRVGDESRKLNFEQRRELEFDKGQAQFDGLPLSNADSSDLDPVLLAQYKQNVGSSSDVEHLLKSRSLLTRDGRLTNAGHLLFSRAPQIEFPQAFVRIIRFLNNERGTGARLGIDDDSDFRIEGPIPMAVEEASVIIEDLIPKRRVLVESGKFEPRPIVPRDAWLEGLVNAVIHRSYSLGGDHIRVEIYLNRIEIESPGRFPGLVNPATPLKISRFARNPRIARVCADLRLGQELGEGIKRIFEEMRRVGLTDPVYSQGQGSVRLVLQATARIDPRTAARLPNRSQAVLDVLRVADRGMGTGEISEEMGMSRPAVTTRLRALEKEGLVRWSGKSDRDPRAVWLLEHS